MEINQINEKRECQGYWEHYWENDTIHSKGYYKDDCEIGYWKNYDKLGHIILKEFYFN